MLLRIQRGEVEGVDTPRAVLLKWYAAIRAKDKTSFLECYHGNTPYALKTAEIMFEGILVSSEFRRKLEAAYGEDAWERFSDTPINADGDNFSPMVFDVTDPDLAEKATIEPEEEDDLGFRRVREMPPIWFVERREGDKWRVVLDRFNNDPEAFRRMATREITEHAEAMKVAERLIGKSDVTVADIKKAWWDAYESGE